jgi:Nucleotidyltransferase of unknown function (DUF6036)
MRRPVDEARIRDFIRALGKEATVDARLYVTGGATAVLLGFRTSTIDLDIEIVPESDALYRAIPRLKEELAVNVELASPSDFIPELPGWQERCRFIVREGKLSFYHYDFYAQALSKIQRGHSKDLEDVGKLIEGGFILPELALQLFESIEGELYRFPALDPPSFRRRVEAALRGR